MAHNRSIFGKVSSRQPVSKQNGPISVALRPKVEITQEMGLSCAAVTFDPPQPPSLSPTFCDPATQRTATSPNYGAATDHCPDLRCPVPDYTASDHLSRIHVTELPAPRELPASHLIVPLSALLRMRHPQQVPGPPQHQHERNQTTTTIEMMGGGSKAMACSTPPNQQISYLPTPPTSFNSAYSDDHADHDTSSNTTLTPTRPSIRRHQQTLTQRANIPSIAEAWTPRTPSMSPDPQLVFPTLAMSDERMSPEREMDVRSREGSPELQRELSPCNEDDWEPRSRSSSPETTMRPPPPRFAHEDSDMLGEGTATMVNAKGRGRGTVSSSSSVASFDMLVSYASVAPADRKEVERTMAPPALARQQSYSFKPNTGTMRKITPSFIRDYTPGSGPQGRSSSSKQSPSPTSGSPPRRRSTSSGYFGSISQTQHAPRRRVDRQRSADVMEHEDIRLRSSVNTIDTDPTSSSQSGMPSFFERLDGDRAQKGWQYASFPEGRLSRSDNCIDLIGSSPRSQRDSLSAAFRHELSSQVEEALLRFKGPLVTLSLFSVIGLTVLAATYGYTVLFSSSSSSLISSSHPNTTLTWGGNVDFATLMNIESAFERVVDSSAGGSELARSLKNSEMAVSDLSTVVRHSDLKCRDTLSQRLERFADDARFNVMGLLTFASDVGGVLDQLLSVNQYALRELKSLQHPPQRLPLVSYLPWPMSYFFAPPSAHSRLSELFDTAAEALESNLRLLIASGQNIETALDNLALQHKPIHDEIIREFSDIRKAQATMSSLWVRFGVQRTNFRENEKLLGEIHEYQDKARGYVEVTLMELRRMTNELAGLRRRVAEPLLVGEAFGKRGVEVEVQVKAVETAVEALVRKRQDREERMRQWNRIILDREMRHSAVETGRHSTRT